MELAPGKAGQETKFIIDDTRYYKTRDTQRFYFVESDNFSPYPKQVLDASLVDALDATTDAKAVRLKKLSLYLRYNDTQITTRALTGVGAALGGTAGMAVMSAAASTNKGSSDDPQLINCDFLARYNGRIIEFSVAEPACEEGVFTCFPMDNFGKAPLKSAALRHKIEQVAHQCIQQAVAEIKTLKTLPPLTDAEQEQR